MAEQHIIINDTTDDVLPLAWGVKGGNVTAHNLTIKPANGSTSANISITNASIVSESSFLISTSNVNDSISIGGNGGISIRGDGTVYVGGAGATNISSGAGKDVSITSGNTISMGSSNIQLSASNFAVTGPTNFYAPVDFNAPANFNSISNFKYTSTFDGDININNSRLQLLNNSTFYMNGNSRFDVNSIGFTINGTSDSTIQTTNGNLCLLAPNRNIVIGNSNDNSVVRMTSATYFSNRATIDSGIQFNNGLTYFSDNTTTIVNSGAMYFNGRYQYISNQPASVNINNGSAIANFAYNTRNPHIFSVNATMSLGLVNPNIVVTAGSLKTEAIVNSDNAIFTNLQYIDNASVVSNNVISVTYTSSEPLFFPDANNQSASIMDSRIANIPISGNIEVDSLDDNTVVEFNAYTENQGVRTPYQFNRDQNVTMYVALLNNNNVGYCLKLIQGYNDSCLDDSYNHCFVKLKDLLNKDDDTHLTNVTLDSSWKFRIVGMCGTASQTSSNLTIYYEYNIYEPKKAGSGGGSSINEDNLYTPYSNLSTYDINDIVIYNNVLYKCIVPVTIPESFDSNKWINTSLGSEITKNTNSLGGLKLVSLTQQEYDALTVYDNHTLYVITNIVS